MADTFQAWASRNRVGADRARQAIRLQLEARTIAANARGWPNERDQRDAATLYRWAREAAGIVDAPHA